MCKKVFMSYCVAKFKEVSVHCSLRDHNELAGPKILDVG